MKWKWPKLPSWQVVRACNIIAAGLCIAGAITIESRWIALLDAFMAGITLQGVFFTTMMIATRKSFDAMSDAFDQMSALNHALIHDKVVFHLTGQPDDDTPPIAPKLH